MTLNGLTHHQNHSRPLLVIAHPGHELRLVNWISKTQPDVVVLTDGSGGSGKPRIAATQRIIAASGARACAVFGSYTDRQVYQAILSGSPALFLDIVYQLIALIRLGRHRVIVRDPYEGYNPTHDLCAMLVDTAASVVRQRYAQCIRIYDFPLTELSIFRPADDLQRLVLSETERALKRSIVAGYVELTGEVNSALRREGARLFHEEVLRELPRESASRARHRTPPYYETYGEKQRAAGRYATVIRHTEHILPIETAIERMAESMPGIQRQSVKTVDRAAAHTNDAL